MSTAFLQDVQAFCGTGQSRRYVGALAGFALIRRFATNCLQFFFHHPGEGLGWVRGVMWYLLTTEIPPAGAPLGAGFDCAAMVGGRA